MTPFERACMVLIMVVCVVFSIMIIPVLGVKKVEVPAFRSLDTGKYVIVKEDTLTLDYMKIKRVYYREK
jgi:hypothetical protein